MNLGTDIADIRKVKIFYNMGQPGLFFIYFVFLNTYYKFYNK